MPMPPDRIRQIAEARVALGMAAAHAELAAFDFYSTVNRRDEEPVAHALAVERVTAAHAEAHRKGLDTVRAYRAALGPDLLFAPGTEADTDAVLALTAELLGTAPLSSAERMELLLYRANAGCGPYGTLTVPSLATEPMPVTFLRDRYLQALIHPPSAPCYGPTRENVPDAIEALRHRLLELGHASTFTPPVPDVPLQPAGPYHLLSLKWSRHECFVWERPDHSGYTMALDDAGVFSEEEAIAVSRPSHGDVVAIPVAVAQALSARVVLDSARGALLVAAERTAHRTAGG